MVQGHVLQRNGRHHDLVVLQSVLEETTYLRSGSAYAMQPLNNKVEYFSKWILLIVLVFLAIMMTGLSSLIVILLYLKPNMFCRSGINIT